MKNYMIKYVETYSGLYNIEAESYEQAVQTLEERLREGAEQGPDVCTDSYFEPECAESTDSEDVYVTIAVDCRFTTTIYGECVDTSSREVVLAAAEAMFSDADIGDLEVIGFRPVSIQTPDGEFVWER